MRLPRRQLLQGAGLAGLGLLARCGRLPWQGEQPAKVPRIGFLAGRSPLPQREALRHGLQELGYVEGRDLVIEDRVADGASEADQFVAEFVAAPVDLLVVGGPVATRTAHRATGAIPIIMVAGSLDPISDGLVVSLARPGGNLTGLTTLQAEVMFAKHLQMVQELVPRATRLGILHDLNVRAFPREAYERPTDLLGLQVHPLEIRTAADFESAFEAATRAQVEVIVTNGTPLFQSQRSRIAELAIQRGLPVIAPFREFAEAGVLMSYGTNLSSLYRRAAYYVDRILKGAKPADLPVEQPMVFDFVINLKTAQALGLTIPHHVLLQATEVIQ
jgi:putative tryptophan/tyrosine transport system substrate-binding protein